MSEHTTIRSGRMDPYTSEVLRECGISGVRLQNKDLNETNLSRKNLSGLDLRGFSLEKTNLEGATLSGSDLRTLHFAKTNCVNANFAGADLRNASLAYGYFHSADFRGADLRGALLQDGLCNDCNFSGADLRGARLGYEHYQSDFRGADLRGITLPPDGDFEKLRCDTSGAIFSPKKKMDAPNMRRVPRVQVRLHHKVHDRITGSQVGLLIDVTLQGLRIGGVSPFPIDAVYPLQIILPGNSARTRTIELDARCVWCKIVGEKNYFHAGFKILTIEEKELRGLERLIEENKENR
jgi:uncharacterized protein YjbI with pentapeptide repeats